MDRVAILCAKDSEMMHEFSRRSFDRLHESSLLSVALSIFSGYQERNVKKEVDKDRLIIEEAAQAFAAGRPACDLDLEDIFEKTKTVDKAFLDSLAALSFTMSLRYGDFADIRIRRIWLIARTVYRLLKEWRDSASFSAAVRSAYAEGEFRVIITEILHLYNLETRMLGGSIRAPFHKAAADYFESLYRAMESVTAELAELYARKIFGDKDVHG